ncbi:MAG: aldo/keto reductase [Dehalococcoidia bacterium]
MYKRLGRNGPEVSVAALGAGGHSRLGQTGGASLVHSIGLVREALDLGITMIDTAPAYGTEHIVGEALQGVIQPIVVSSKASIRSKDGRRVDAVALRESIEQSLKRLRREHLDILYLHGVAAADYDFCLLELVPELQAMRNRGLITQIGISERFNEEPDHAMMRRAAAHDVWDVLMVGLNFFNQSALQNVVPEAKKRGAGIVCMHAVRGSLARVDKLAQLTEVAVSRGEVDAGIDARQLAKFVTSEGGSLSDVAYRFCRHQSGIDSVLTGTGSSTHLQQNVSAIFGPPLPQDVEEALRYAYGRVRSHSGEI